MITEDYCSYEVAKLLKEKGFDEQTRYAYTESGKADFSSLTRYWNQGSLYACPTLQMAMKWLREVHHILITVVPQEIRLGVDRMCYAIYRITEDLYQPLYNGRVDNLVDSYEEAVEAALKYSLEKLI